MRRLIASFPLILLLIGVLSFAFEVKQASLVKVRENGDCLVRVLPGVVDVGAIGQTFTVAVVIEVVSNVTGFSVQFSWDRNILAYVDHTPTVPIEDYPDPQPPSPYGGILHSPILTIMDDVNTNAGTYTAVFATLGGPQFHGNGTAFTITFEVMYQEAYDIETILDITSAVLGGDPVPPSCQLHDGIVRIDGWSLVEYVYINSDGSINPPTTNITTTDNVTYTFIDNINATLDIGRDDIIVDGAGYTLRSEPSGYLSGIYMVDRTNVTIKNIKITDFQFGVGANNLSHCTFIDNDITSSEMGFLIFNFNYNLICGNNITGGFNSAFTFYEHTVGNTICHNTITSALDTFAAFHFLGYSAENVIFQNTITNCAYVVVGSSNDTLLYHNNFINVGYYPTLNPNISFDDGYPSGGNYWSDYTGVDLFSGPYQNETGSDGVGDTPFVLNSKNRDRYPFIAQDGWENHPFSIESNVTITNRIISPATFYFNVSGPSSSTGYVNVTIPKGLNSTAIKVFLDETELVPPPFPIITVNSSHYSIYFKFTLSNHQVIIQFALGDITVTEVTLSRTVVGQGYSVLVNATLANIGDYNTTIGVISQANSSVFGNQTGVFLAKGTSVLISFVWNTTEWSKGNYSLSIYTAPCEGEANISNNILSCEEEVCVTILGDVDVDFDVDIFDIVAMAGSYGSETGDPEYEANYDLIYNGQIDIFDIVAACGHYGESW